MPRPTRWAWHAAIELGEHVAYPARYRTCHPIMGSTLKFPDMAEQHDALRALASADERVASRA